MRLRATAPLLAVLAACALSPAAAAAADSPLPYSVDVTADQAAVLRDEGYDVAEGRVEGDSGLESLQIVGSCQSLGGGCSMSTTPTVRHREMPVANELVRFP